MTWLHMLAAVVANAFGRRFGGGLLGQWLGDIGGTQVARLAQAAMAGGTVAALAPVWWWGLAVVPAVWLGATMGFGRAGVVPRGLGDVIDLAVVHGLVSVAPLALTLGGLHWWRGGMTWAPVLAALVVLGAGLLRGPAYWLATLWQPHAPALGLNRDGIPDPPAWGEFLSGGLLGAGMFLALAVGA